MINYHNELVEALQEVLPTYYEMIITNNTPIPCITYMERGNIATDTGDTIGYSRISYNISIWGYSLKDLQEYSIMVDDKMRKLGFKRVSSNEMTDNQTTLIRKILGYECLALEQFN